MLDYACNACRLLLELEYRHGLGEMLCLVLQRFRRCGGFLDQSSVNSTAHCRQSCAGPPAWAQSRISSLAGRSSLLMESRASIRAKAAAPASSATFWLGA